MISIGKYGTYEGSQSTSNRPLLFILIINYFHPYVIEHNTNVLIKCLQKYQGTGFNSVIKFSGSV